MTNINIHKTDIIDYLKKQKSEKFHAVISDPPYGLAFMGKEWDKYTPRQYQEWVTEWASLLLEHLYPGAVCMFFGGTRTYHRLATGLEDAGFEIFDSMVWNYASGFPKSHNISKAIDKSFGLEREITGYQKAQGNAREKGAAGHYANAINSVVGNKENVKDGWNITKPNSELAQTWNGYGTALKPAFEPIVLCRKPRGKETYVNCVLNYGSSALNIDGCRVGDDVLINKPSQNHNTTNLHNYGLSPNGKENTVTGRYPANFGLICTCESNPCECVEKELDSQSGISKSHGSDYNWSESNNDNPTHITKNIKSGKHFDDKGGASRFFYTAKASRKERNLGLGKNNHPTVKPIKLTEYLSKLLLPPIDNSSILIPFAGSGSEIIGAMLSGWNVITALEISDEYCNIAQNRVDYWKQFESYSEAMKG